MLDSLKKFGRTLQRDYLSAVPDNGETFMLPSPSHHTLAREMKICATLALVTTGALALCLPFAIGGGLLVMGVLATPAAFVIRCREVSKAALKKTSAEIALPFDRDDPCKTAILCGAAPDLRIVSNTQLMVETLTKGLQEKEVPQAVLDKLAPYFNDCAEAAARLEVTIDGQALDHIPLSRPRSLFDDCGMLDWREEVRPFLTQTGAQKKQAADTAAARTAATIAAIAQTQEGIGQTLTVKPIRLRVRA